MKPFSFEQLEEIAHNVTAELIHAYHNRPSDFAFLQQNIKHTPLVKLNEPFQVLTIDGSIFESAMVKKTETGINIISFEDGEIPTFRTQADFLEFVDNFIDQKTTVAAINFAYSLKPIIREERIDGELIIGSKEHRFEGMIGKNIGELIENHIQRVKKRTFFVAIANDTICLLLSGLDKSKPETLACGVLGTGLNFAFFLDEKKVVNLEAANFSHFPQSVAAKYIDKSSTIPGIALLEKETSGAYLYKLFNHIIEEKKIQFKKISSTKELDALVAKEGEIGHIAQTLFTHSAQLIACIIAGIIEFKQTEMTFIMDGSLFWDAYGYKENVLKHIYQLIPHTPVNIERVEHATIIGAMQLVI